MYREKIGDMRTRSKELYGRDFYSAYKAMGKDDICTAWKCSYNFYSWLLYDKHDEVLYKGDIVRIDKTKPWGPDNCRFGKPIKQLREELNKKFGSDFYRKFINLMQRHPEEICDEWKNDSRAFLEWALYGNHGPIFYGSWIGRKDINEPWGPDNCEFYTDDKSHSSCRRDYKEKSEELKGLKQKIQKIRNDVGINFESIYETNVKNGKIVPEIWTRKDFFQWASDLYDAGKLQRGLHMHRINRNKPYFTDNAYFSFGQGENKTHGLSGTRIYNKFTSWDGYYKNRFEEDVSAKDFASFAVTHGYSEHNGVHTDGRRKNTITWNDVSFPDNGKYDDYNRIISIYATIPQEEDGFGSREKFISWSVLSGYTEDKEFRKVGAGTYSPDTCVWDYFTTEAYLKYRHKMLKHTIYSSKTNSPAYKKWISWRRNGGVCSEWENFNDFVLWYNKQQKPGMTMRVRRKDTTKPFSPDNITITYKPEEESGTYYVTYGKMCKEVGVDKKWDTIQKFIGWCQKNGVTACCRVSRINPNKPFGPNNVEIFRPTKA